MAGDSMNFLLKLGLPYTHYTGFFILSKNKKYKNE